MSYSQMFPAPPTSPRRASSSHYPSSRRPSLSPSFSFTSTPATTASLNSSSLSSSSLPKSTLQNNIVALLLFKGSSIPLAMERFHASLNAAETANTNINKPTNINTDGHEKEDNDDQNSNTQSLSSRISTVISSSFMQPITCQSSSTHTNSSNNVKKMIHNADVQGLTWFHNKVLREVLSSPSNQNHNHNHNGHNHNHQGNYSRRTSINTIPPIERSMTANRSKSMSHVMNHTNNSSSSSSSNHHHYIHLRDHLRNGSTATTTTTNNSSTAANDNKEGDLFMYHHCHINENILLGLEYIHDPICLLGKETRTTTNQYHHDDHTSHNCEMNVQIAAGINIALCLWSSNQYYDQKDDGTNDNDQGDNKKKKMVCRNRIRMKKANDAMNVLNSILEYIKEQTDKSGNDNKTSSSSTNDESRIHHLENYCYCCQQKKKKEAKERGANQLSNSCTNMGKSWAKKIVEESSDDDDGEKDNTETDSNKNPSQSSPPPSCPDPKLLVIVHNNIGVLYFILNKTAEAKYHFEQAKALILSIRDAEEAVRHNTHEKNRSFTSDTLQRRRSASISGTTTNNVPIRTQLLQTIKYRRSSFSSYLPDNKLFSLPPPPLVSSTSSFCNIPKSNDEYQNNNLLPSMQYLHLTIILNLTRVTIRMNGMLEDAKTLNTELNNLISVIIDSDSTIQGLSSSKSVYQYQHQHHSSTTTRTSTTTATQRIKWLITVSNHYIPGLIQQRLEHHTQSLEHYNKMLSYARKELGHDHIFVAMILEKKGNLLFDQRKYQNAMLSYLASLRIVEHQSLPPFVTSEQQQQNGNPSVCNGYQLEQSKLLYAIGRTLHDGEEFADALGMYKKALSLLEVLDDENGKNRAIVVESIQIMCNIGRIYQITGELELSLNVNLKIVDMASEMVGGSNSTVLHPFVRNRLVVVGNVYVEMRRLNDAMSVFGRVARGSEEGTDWMVGHLRPSVEDVDTSAFAVRAAERLGELGAKNLSPHAAAA